MLLCVTVVFISCDKDGEAASTTTVATTTKATNNDDNGDDDNGGTTAATTTALTTAPPPVVPAGYSIYSDGYIQFAYPESWHKDQSTFGTVDLSTLDDSEEISIELESSSEYFEMTPSEIESTTPYILMELILQFSV